jgi:hypothetical protein
MKSFSRFLIEEKSKTIIHKLKWPDADNFTGGNMSFRKKLSIANKHSNKIGNGSARDVFEIDYDHFTAVMKIAKNVKGFRQNLAEVNLYKKYNYNPNFMVPMMEFDDNDDADISWLVVVKATKFDEGTFFRYFDVPFKEFRQTLSAIINNDEDKHKKNKKIQEFVKFVKKNKLQLGEMRQRSNWGSYEQKPVIVDAGLTKDNMSIAL